MPSVDTSTLISPAGSWEATAHQHCVERDLKLASHGYAIPEVSAKTLNVFGAAEQVLSKDELEIVNSSPASLVSRLAEGKLKAVDVTVSLFTSPKKTR
jgi:hypothetical protein